MKRDELRNGLELVLTMQLALELMDEYNLKGLAKKHANIFKNTLEKSISQSYDNVYKNDPEMSINALNIKQRLIENVASFTEPDAILFSEFTQKFVENIELARKKGAVMFDKLL